MPHQNIVFHALLKHLPWAVVDRLVERYGADPDPRGLKTKAHLIALLGGQLQEIAKPGIVGIDRCVGIGVGVGNAFSERGQNGSGAQGKDKNRNQK